MEDMRLLEKKSTENVHNSNFGDSKKNKNEWKKTREEEKKIKRIKNQIKNIEKDISKVENEISKFDLILSSPDGYEKMVNQEGSFEVYEQNKKKLKELEDKWEVLECDLEELI